MAKKKAEKPEVQTGSKVRVDLDLDGKVRLTVTSVVENAEGGSTSRTEDVTDAAPAVLRNELKRLLTAVGDAVCEDVETLSQIDANQFDIWKAGKTDPKVRQLNFKESLKGVADEVDLDKRSK